MKIYINKLQYVAFSFVLMLLVSACSTDQFTGDSVVKPTNPTVTITAPSVPGSFDYGVGGAYEFTVTLSEPQIVDVKVAVELAGDGVEGVDYDVSEHIVIVPAQQTSASKSIVLTVYTNTVREADRSLTMTVGNYRTANASVSPSSVTTTFKKAPENVLNPPAAPDVEFTLWWEFTDGHISSDICDLIDDLDLTWQTNGSGFYANDLMGFACASLACPEEGSLLMADMNDGEVYDAYIAIYSGFDAGEAGAVTVHVDYSRANSNFVGSVAIEGVFDSSMGGSGAAGLLTLERNGDVITIKDGTTGDTIGSGRVNGEAVELQKVEKPS